MKNNKKGFTLVELLVVMAIMGILILIAAPRFMSITEGAKKRTLDGNHRILISAINMYIGEYGGKTPTDIDELMVYVKSSNPNKPDDLDGSPDGSTYTYDAGVLTSKLVLKDATNPYELTYDINE